MTNLETPLFLSPNINIRINGDALVIRRRGNRTLTIEQHGWDILNLFRDGMSLRNAITQLGTLVDDKQQWIALTTVVKQLAEARILVSADASTTNTIGISPQPTFKKPMLHAKMLHDTARTQVYINAVKDTVKEGDVVVEIGTGTGVLAVAAAQAGARKVYAIEVLDMVHVARETAKRNGVSDRVEVIHGLSSEIELPEKADVLISETVSNDILGENIIPIFLDAHQRFLKPDASIIPQQLMAYGVAVQISEATYQQAYISETHIDTWKQQYQIDLSALREATPLQSTQQRQLYEYNSTDIRDMQLLSDPTHLFTLDLAARDEQGVAVQPQKITLTQAGNVGGVLIYFDTLVGGGHSLSLHPDITAYSSWEVLVCHLTEPKPLAVGATLTIQPLKPHFYNELRYQINIDD